MPKKSKIKKIKPLNRELDAGDERAILRLLDRGETVAATARELRCSRKTVRNVRMRVNSPRRKRRFIEPPAVQQRRKKRQAKVASMATATVARGKKRKLRVRRYSSAQSIALALPKSLKASASTVRRDLRLSGLRSRVRPLRPNVYLTDPYRRVAFAAALLRSDICFSSLLFSDEKNFNTNDYSHRKEWVPLGTRPSVRTRCRWAPMLMVWAVIGHNFKHLHVWPPKTKISSVEYQAAVERVLPRLAGKTLQQDGARAHTAQDTRAFMARNGVHLLENWPPRSPDLSPIENLWALLQVNVSRRCPFDVDELAEVVKEEFAGIPMSIINSLVMSFEGRLRTCVELDGGYVQ